LVLYRIICKDNFACVASDAGSLKARSCFSLQRQPLNRHPLNYQLISLSLRYDVKGLLQHDFFLEDSGVKVEVVKAEEGEVEGSIVQLRVRVVDPKKRKDKHKENEAIQFDFDIGKDNPEEVAQEMVRFAVFILIFTQITDKM
jgi:WNK lysine deficient protein kinase